MLQHGGKNKSELLDTTCVFFKKLLVGYVCQLLKLVELAKTSRFMLNS